MRAAKKDKSDRSLYLDQNRKIHKARAQIGMGLDDCRLIAKEINGKASISALSLRQRWELIEMLKAKGAYVFNPLVSKAPVSSQGAPQAPPNARKKSTPENEARHVGIEENPKDVYLARLAYWNKRFPKGRPGFASNKQLAWIQTLWELDFNDGRAGSSNNGLRGFVYRQTKSLEKGPVSDLAFLRDHHVKAVLSPLRAVAKKKHIGSFDHLQ